MFGRPKKRKRRDADEPVRGDIGMAADDFSAGESMEDPDTGQEPELMDQSADDGMDQEDQELMRQSSESRSAAVAKNSRDDQMRMTVFSCACVVAGFCGIAGIIFGTAAVCRSLGNTGSVAASPVQSPYVAGVDPSNMDAYYDQAGRMHVNVYMSKQPDVDITIHVDADGNVTADAAQRPGGSGEGVPGEGSVTEPGTEEPSGETGGEQAGGDAATDGDDAAQGQASANPGTGAQDGEGAEDGASDGSSKPGSGTAQGNNGTSEPDGQAGGDGTTDPEGEGSGSDAQGTGTGSQPATANKTEQEILEEQSKREEGGSSGYLESDGKYVVKQGDTLSAVSNKLGFSVDFLAAYNHLKDKNLIITGETLRYPVFD